MLTAVESTDIGSNCSQLSGCERPLKSLGVEDKMALGLLNGLGLNDLGLGGLGLGSLGIGNQSLLGVVHTYDSGGQLPLPGVMIGTEDINVGLAPDNDPTDLGIDIFANIANGVGPQYDGQGLGAYLDLDTTFNDGLFGIDDSDSNIGSDLAILGNAGQPADDNVLGVHLSGVGPHAVDGLGDVVDTGGFTDGLGIGGLLGLLDWDNA